MNFVRVIFANKFTRYHVLYVGLKYIVPSAEKEEKTSGLRPIMYSQHV